MTPSLMLLIAILVLIFITNSNIEKMLNRLQKNINHTAEELDKKIQSVRDLCAPLYLLNIYNDVGSINLGDCILELEKAAKKIHDAHERFNREEKQELENLKKVEPNKRDFTPSESLEYAALKVCIAHTLYGYAEANLAMVQPIFIDVISGKISVEEGKKLANEKQIKYDEFSMEDDPEVKKRYKFRLKQNSERWKNGAWKERLEFYQRDEMNDY